MVPRPPTFKTGSTPLAKTCISKHSNNPKCWKRLFKLNVAGNCYLFTIPSPLHSAHHTSHAYRFTTRTCSDVRRWVVEPDTRQSEVILNTSTSNRRATIRVYTSGNIFHETYVNCPILARCIASLASVPVRHNS